MTVSFNITQFSKTEIIELFQQDRASGVYILKTLEKLCVKRLAKKLLEMTNIENNGAPWAFAPTERMKWAEGLEMASN